MASFWRSVERILEEFERLEEAVEEEVERFRRLMSRFEERVPGFRRPRMEVYDRGDRLEVVAELPGASKEQVDVRATERQLTIHADTGTATYHGELLLPCEVNPDTARATYRNGVLTVTLEKRVKGRRIPVE